jgi:protein-S-isoprenylcysteine O-methyltransferase Ste14
MEPYFFTNHVAGLLMTVVVPAWGMMELSQRSQPQREGATRIGGAGSRLAFLACLIATAIAVNLAPRVVPAAAIRPGAVAFAAGLVILLAGLVLRGWSFKTLGQYFTHRVVVSSDQPVIAAGPYRLLRHPGYAAVLLIGIGVSLASANWAGLAAVTLLILMPLLWRIHIEEHALTATLGQRYRTYSAQRKRLIPLIW